MCVLWTETSKPLFWQLKESLPRYENTTGRCKIECSITLYLVHRQNRFLKKGKQKVVTRVQSGLSSPILKLLFL